MVVAALLVVRQYRAARLHISHVRPAQCHHRTGTGKISGSEGQSHIYSYYHVTVTKVELGNENGAVVYDVEQQRHGLMVDAGTSVVLRRLIATAKTKSRTGMTRGNQTPKANLF